MPVEPAAAAPPAAEAAQSRASDAEPAPTEPNTEGAVRPPKNIVILSDGTGNSERTPFKTNVWRTYQALSLAPGRQIARYDDGVGTSAVKPLAALGGAFGWGLKRNVTDLYKFLCRNYADGDQIYCFGFSRGAFTIRVLVGFLDNQGLVRSRDAAGNALPEEELTRRVNAAYRAYRDAKFKAPLARLGRWLRDATLRLRDRVLGLKPHEEAANPPPPIRFLGLWDTVDAYGMPIRELKSAVDRYIWPLTFRNLELSDTVICARHALSLDDERATFHPLIWDEHEEVTKVREGRVPPDRIRQVWFPGVHANLGGGYPDDGLAHVPLLWMLGEAQEAGLALEPELVRLYRAIANPFGKIYDSRSGFASFYRYSPRRIDRAYLPYRNPVRPDSPYTASPVLIHASVYVRMVHGLYAPISIHGPVQCEPAGSSIVRTYHQEAMEFVLDTVWWRRIAYWAMVVISALLAGFPWLAGLADASPEDHTAEEFLHGSFIFPLLKMVLPSFAGLWVDSWGAHPLFSSILLLGGLTIFIWGMHLRDRVEDRARAAWHTAPGANFNPAAWIQATTRRQNEISRVVMAAAIAILAPTFVRQAEDLRGWAALVGLLVFAPLVVVPLWLDHWWRCAFPGISPAGTALNLARFFRTNTAAVRVQRFVVKQAIPFAFVISIFAGAFYAANDLGFAVLSATGSVCAATPDAKPLAASGETRTFDIKAPCFATGIRVAAGAKYRITFTPETKGWRDASIDLDRLPHRITLTGEPRRSSDGYATLDAGVPFILALAAPLRRHVDANWFKPLARIGRYGSEEIILGPTSTVIEPQATDELFLYVNDAVIGVPYLWDFFYRNNHGAATVEIRQIAAPDSF